MSVSADPGAPISLKILSEMGAPRSTGILMLCLEGERHQQIPDSCLFSPSIAHPAGPRQSGKTTLAKKLRPDYEYINLELEENSDFARNDPHGFLTAHQGGVILDEVQYVPTLFPYLKHYTDLRGSPGEYILTGSQHFLLLEKITQSLAGRVALLQLLPFSLTELQNTGLYPASPEAFILTGGYPRIYDKNIAPSDFYPAYIRT